MNEQRNQASFCAEAVPSRLGTLIADDDLRKRGVTELEIDALDRTVATQKVAIGGRPRAAVEAWLTERGYL